MNDPLVRITS